MDKKLEDFMSGAPEGSARGMSNGARPHDTSGDVSPFGDFSAREASPAPFVSPSAAMPAPLANKPMPKDTVTSPVSDNRKELDAFVAEFEEEKITIDDDFFSFITPHMVCLMIILTTIVMMMKTLINTSFHAHVELNSVIISLTFFGVYRIFANNSTLWVTARYLKRIERMEANPATTAAEYKALEDALHKQGHMLDTQNMQMALRKMGALGLFVITDNDARLIKSKLGSRVRHQANHIPFFAGLLISFGLLGTFMGLITTVAAVAEQLGLVSASFGQPGGMDTMDLIKGISAPLGGMGTAFGASLFGLSGSMLLGGLNYMASHGQNNAIENISRWFDDHIPHIKPGLNKQIAQAKAELERVKNESNGDGKGAAAAKPTAVTQALLAAEAPAGGNRGGGGGGSSMEMGAFITLAEETHKHLRTLGHKLTGEIEIQSKALQQQENFLTQTQSSQQNLFGNVMQQHQAIMAMLAEQQQVQQKQQDVMLESLRLQHQEQLKQQQEQLGKTEERLSLLDKQLGSLGGTGGKIVEALQSWRTGMSSQYDQHGKTLQEMQKREQELGQMVKQLTANQQHLQTVLASMPLKELKPTVNALEKLASRVQSLLEKAPAKSKES